MGIGKRGKYHFVRKQEESRLKFSFHIMLRIHEGIPLDAYFVL